MWLAPVMHLKVVEGLVGTRDPVEGLGLKQYRSVYSLAGQLRLSFQAKNSNPRMSSR